jgi:hypothetical protein
MERFAARIIKVWCGFSDQPKGLKGSDSSLALDGLKEIGIGQNLIEVAFSM